MLGPLLALFSAAFFALQAITSRRGVIRIPDASIGVVVTVFMAPPLFTLVLLSFGQADKVISFPWQSYAFLAGAGIVHFVVGRSLNFATVKHIGANRATICLNTASIYSVICGILLFNETLNWQVAMGAGLIIAGTMAMALTPTRASPESDRHFGSVLKGVLLGLTGGIFYGISPLMVKAGLGEAGSPLAGAFISYLGASAAMGIMLANKEKRTSLTGMGRGAFWWFFLTGLILATAQTMRYFALSLSPVSIVAPLGAITPLLVVAFSFVLNRRLESFSPMIILAAVAVVLGTIILL